MANASRASPRLCLQEIDLKDGLMRSLSRGARTVADQFRRDVATRWLVTLIVAANAIAIGMPAVMELNGLKPPRHLDPMVDGSFPEYLNYVQTLACALFVALRWWRDRMAVLLALAVTLVIVFVDDAFQYHERMGSFLAGTLGLPALPTLRAQDTGELLAMAIEGAIVVPLLAYGLTRPGAFDSGQAPLLIACLGLFIFCGAGIDMLHVATNSQLVGYLEDGGEMLAMAAACAIAFAFLRVVPGRQPEAAAVVHQ